MRRRRYVEVATVQQMIRDREAEKAMRAVPVVASRKKKQVRKHPFFEAMEAIVMGALMYGTLCLLFLL